MLAEHAPQAPVAVVDGDVLRAVAGFDIHRGALASVQRRAPVDLAEAVRLAGDGSGLLLALEGVNDHENLGSLYRNAAAFGVAAVAIDPTSADPFYRRSVRVSLGHVLAVPTTSMDAAPAGLERLHDLGARIVALDPDADRPLHTLDRATIGNGPVAVLVGAEGPGLTAAALDAADLAVSIPMAPGVDSINVAAASAVALHHLATLDS